MSDTTTYDGEIVVGSTGDGRVVLIAFVDGAKYMSLVASGTASPDFYLTTAEKDLRRWVGFLEHVRDMRRLEGRGEPLINQITRSLAEMEELDGPEKILR